MASDPAIRWSDTHDDTLFTTLKLGLLDSYFAWTKERLGACLLYYNCLRVFANEARFINTEYRGKILNDTRRRWKWCRILRNKRTEERVNRKALLYYMLNTASLFHTFSTRVVCSFNPRIFVDVWTFENTLRSVENSLYTRMFEAYRKFHL